MSRKKMRGEERKLLGFFCFLEGGRGGVAWISNSSPYSRPKYAIFHFPFSDLVLVVQRADNFIHWIVRYPADKMCVRFSRDL